MSPFAGRALAIAAHVQSEVILDPVIARLFVAERVAQILDYRDHRYRGIVALFFFDEGALG